MPARRLTSILAALLVIAGLSALPTSSLARPTAPASHRQVDDPSQTDEGGTVDDGSTDESGDLSDADLAALDDQTGDSCDSAGDLPVDDGSADPTDDSTDDPSSGDNTNSDDTGTDTRQAPDDPTDDPSADNTGDDTSTDDTGDDPSLDDTGDTGDTVDCATELTDDEILGDVGDGEAKNLGKKGIFTETFTMPEGGTIDETLTGGASGRAVIAKVKVLGGAHKKVAKAGTVTVRIKLNKQGRKALRTSRRALKLTLSTRISLKSGRTIKRTKALTVKPSKKAPAKSKGKHKKPSKKPKH